MENFKDHFDYEENETDIDEVTTAGTGVGKFPKPLGMGKKRKKELAVLMKGFDNTIKGMCRSDLLKHTRKMGLTLGHLQDCDVRKTITTMSLRNKRRFLGAGIPNKHYKGVTGTGSGDPENTGIYSGTVNEKDEDLQAKRIVDGAIQQLAKLNNKVKDKSLKSAVLALFGDLEDALSKYNSKVF